MSILSCDDVEEDCANLEWKQPVQTNHSEGCGSRVNNPSYRDEINEMQNDSNVDKSGLDSAGNSCSSSQHSHEHSHCDSGYGTCSSQTESYDSLSHEFKRRLKLNTDRDSYSQSIIEKNNESFVNISEHVTPVKVHYEEVIPRRKEERCYKSLTGVDVPKDVVDEIYAQDEDGDTKLHMAMIHEQEEICYEFIHLAPTSYWLDIPNCLLQTPLHLAVITKLPDVIRRLMISGACITLQDTKGYTPLHVACLQNDVDAAWKLLMPMQGDEGFLHPQMIPQNLEIKNYEGKTCLHLAAEQCNIVIMNLLLNGGADINAEDGKSGRTCLHYAAESGNSELSQFLVKRPGLNVNSKTYGGETAMGLATGHSHYDIVKLLHENGARYSDSERDELELGSYNGLSNGEIDMEEGNR